MSIWTISLYFCVPHTNIWTMLDKYWRYYSTLDRRWTWRSARLLGISLIILVMWFAPGVSKFRHEGLELYAESNIQLPRRNLYFLGCAKDFAASCQMHLWYGPSMECGARSKSTSLLWQINRRCNHGPRDVKCKNFATSGAGYSTTAMRLYSRFGHFQQVHRLFSAT